MPRYDWIALAVFLVALVIGLIWASFHAYRAWRRGLPAFRRMSAAGEELSGRAAALEQRIAALERKATALQRDANRLSDALAKARVLRAAVQDAKSMFDRALIFFPR